MHELDYEPEQGDPAAARWLARWVAMGTLLVFSLNSTGHALTLAQVVLEYGSASFVEAAISGERALGYALLALALPMCVAVALLWLLTGRVQVVGLAMVPALPALGLTSLTIPYANLLSPEGLFGTLGAILGDLLLVWLFLTPTFRRALNAPRHRIASRMSR